MVPKNFVSLQLYGFRCENYYFGAGGQKLGLTSDHLAAVGLVDDTLWVDRSVLSGLDMASKVMSRFGFGIIITDAWRPYALYGTIEKLMMEGNSKSLLPLMNLKDRPHSTGMAIDIIPVDLRTGEKCRTRNQARDGIAACLVDYYKHKHDPESVEYQRIQEILVISFKAAGFRLGTKKEYWHFELPGASTAPRF